MDIGAGLEFQFINQFQDFTELVVTLKLVIDLAKDVVDLVFKGVRAQGCGFETAHWLQRYLPSMIGAYLVLESSAPSILALFPQRIQASIADLKCCAFENVRPAFTISFHSSFVILVHGM